MNAPLRSQRYYALDAASLYVDHEVVPASANLPLDACNMFSMLRRNAVSNKVPGDSIGRFCIFYLPIFVRGCNAQSAQMEPPALDVMQVWHLLCIDRFSVLDDCCGIVFHSWTNACPIFFLQIINVKCSVFVTTHSICFISVTFLVIRLAIVKRSQFVSLLWLAVIKLHHWFPLGSAFLKKISDSRYWKQSNRDRFRLKQLHHVPLSFTTYILLYD